MSKPWEKYQGDQGEAETTSGPWDNYKTEEPEPDPDTKEEETATSTFSRVLGAVGDAFDYAGETGYAFLNNVGQTALGNYDDEIGAAARSAYDIATSSEFDLGDYGPLYDYNKKQIQGFNDQVDADSPIASVAGNVTGAVAGLPAIAAGKYIAQAPGAISAVGRSLLAGAGEGALLTSGATDMEELNADGSNSVDRYLDYGGAIADGAGWGAAGGTAGGVVGIVAGPIAKRIWRSLGSNQKATAIKEIRDRALEYGIDADEVIKMMNKNPEMTLADVDVAMRDMARGLGQANPQAMNTARGTLVERNRQAPERIGEALEEASGVPLNRADEIAAEAEAVRKELGQQYNEINEASVPMGDKVTWKSDGARYDGVKAGDELADYLPINIESSPAQKIIKLMPEEYNAALANYRRSIKNPDFDPMEEGFIPGQMIQDMKTAADKTAGAATTSGAARGAAQSVSKTLREIADEYIPGYGPLREEYGRRVLQPEQGLEAAKGYFTGGWEKLQDMLSRADKLTPAGEEAFNAGIVRGANNAVRNVPSAKGTGNYAGPLTRTETAGERVAEVIPEARRGQFDEVLDDELTMHTTMSEVTGVGSPTAQNQAASVRLGQGRGEAIQEAINSFINKVNRSESQVESMKILLDSNLDEQALREILESPYIGKPVREMIDRYLGSENAGSAVMGAAGGLLIPEAMQ